MACDRIVEKLRLERPEIAQNPILEGRIALCEGEVWCALAELSSSEPKIIENADVRSVLLYMNYVQACDRTSGQRARYGPCRITEKGLMFYQKHATESL